MLSIRKVLQKQHQHQQQPITLRQFASLNLVHKTPPAARTSSCNTNTRTPTMLRGVSLGLLCSQVLPRQHVEHRASSLVLLAKTKKEAAHGCFQSLFVFTVPRRRNAPCHPDTHCKNLLLCCETLTRMHQFLALSVLVESSIRVSRAASFTESQHEEASFMWITKNNFAKAQNSNSIEIEHLRLSACYVR